jgi:Kef-type K+ transport system membrane component KefB
MVLTVLGFFGIRSLGFSLEIPEGPVATGLTAASGALSGDALADILAAILVVLIVARGLGSCFARLGQPRVIGEIVAGIVLGPSLLGRLSPGTFDYLFPSSVVPHLGVLSQVGVILYMFLVGLHLDTRMLQRKIGASLVIAHAGILAPLLFGSAVSLWLYSRWAGPGVGFPVFALFIGLAMSVTAFPVLARILSDRRMQESPLGVLTLACAAIGDVTAWCLLTLVVGVADSEPARVVLTVGSTLLFIAVLHLLLRPLATRYFASRSSLPGGTQGMLAIVCVGLLLAALTSEAIGIHALFGAFLLGAILPHDAPVLRDIAGKLEDAVVVLLLPVFFAFTGLRTQLGLVDVGQEWLACGLILFVASAAKFGGTWIAARMTGSTRTEASTLGVLMNTRGLMELIVLNLGLDLGILSPTLFAMFVLMAVVTTLSATPLLRWIAAGESKVLVPPEVAQARSRPAK